MPLSKHVEQHFTAGAVVRDVVIGMSDGLTVPFALAAGLTGAVAHSGLILTAGLAEIAAGSIAMGLGGYLAGRGDVEHYEAERAREIEEVAVRPEDERNEVMEVLRQFGLQPDESRPIAHSLSTRPDDWVAFMMRFELGLEEPEPDRAWKSALTIAGAYIVGGLVPLAPYFVTADARAALPVSTGVTLLALAAFGFLKARFTGAPRWRGTVQTVAIGGLAAAAAFGLARLLA